MDERPLMAAGATSVVLGLRFYPWPIQGALILTPNRLRFESGWVEPPIGMTSWSRQLDIPFEAILEVRKEVWPSGLRLAVAYNIFSFFLLWPGYRRLLQANLAVEAQSGAHHFRVRDPEAWLRALAGRGIAAAN